MGRRSVLVNRFAQFDGPRRQAGRHRRGPAQLPQLQRPGFWSFRGGDRRTNGDPGHMNRENVASELLRLERGGLIQPKAAVEWARAHPSSALHAELEWDDAIAGEQYRIQQVRQLIQVFVEPVHHTRQYVSLSIDRVGGGGYRHINSVMNTPDLRTVLLQDALRE